MNRSVIIALVLALAVSGWIASGQIDLFGDKVRPTVAAEAAVPAAKERRAVKVRGRVLKAAKWVSEVVVRGRTEAVRSVDLRAETYGQVAEVAVAEGVRVSQGDAVVRLALDDRQARLRQAEALARQRQLEYDAAKKLAEKGYRARTKMAAAAAALDAAKAAVAQIRIEIDHTVIRAPFDGVVEVRHAEIGDYLKVGDVVATVVDQDPYLVVAHVSERDVGKLKLDTPATARLITGERVSGKLRYIATMADPATRTFRIEVEVPNEHYRLRAGITSEIRVPVEKISAHLVSPAILTRNDDGAIGIRVVNSESIVEFHPAEIVGDETAGVWLGGLPEIITVITVGQEYVRVGDHIEVVIEDAKPAS